MERDTPVRDLWGAAGRPATPKAIGPASGPCWWCGLPMDGIGGIPLKDAIGEGFADQSEASCPPALAMCPACQWSMSGVPPRTFRAWSLVYAPGVDWGGLSHQGAQTSGLPVVPGLCYLSKADMGPLLDVLSRTLAFPWAAVVAGSGKVHTLPFARWTRPGSGWHVRFDRNDIHCSPARFCAIMDVLSALYGAGYAKADIESGDPPTWRMVRCGIDLWRRHEPALRQLHGSALLALALLLLRRDEDGQTNWPRDDDLRPGAGCNPVGPGGELVDGQQAG